MPEPSRGVLVAVKLVHVGHRQLSVSGLITYLRQVTAAGYLQQFSSPPGVSASAPAISPYNFRYEGSPRA